MLPRPQLLSLVITFGFFETRRDKTDRDRHAVSKNVDHKLKKQIIFLRSEGEETREKGNLIHMNEKVDTLKTKETPASHTHPREASDQ